MGGFEAIKGYLIQAIVFLIDALKVENNWDSFQIEPIIQKPDEDHISEKVDIKWNYKNPKKTKIVQVKHSKNQINKPDVKKWVTELRSSVQVEEYELCIAGSFSEWVVKNNIINSTNIKRFNVELEDLIAQAAQQLGMYIANQNWAELRSKTNLTLLKSLITEALLFSNGKEITRAEFNKILNNFIQSILEGTIQFSETIPKILEDNQDEILNKIDLQADRIWRQDRKSLRIKIDKNKVKNLILIEFNVFPLTNKKQIIDSKSEEFEKFLENLWEPFHIQYPTSPVYFSEYLKDHNSIENGYDFEYEDSNSRMYDYSKIRIYENGQIFIGIIFSTETFRQSYPNEFLRIPEAERKKLDDSYVIFHSHLPFIFLLSLKLIKLLYSQGDYDGKVKNYCGILSNKRFSLFFGSNHPLMNRSKVSNDIEIKFNNQIEITDLNSREKVFEMVRQYLSEILKRCNTKMDERNKLLKRFDSTINEYLEKIFNF